MNQGARLDARALRPSRLVPPLSKSDAQRALVLAHLLERPEWVAQLDADVEPPSDVVALRRGLKALASRSVADIDCQDGGAPLRLLLGQAAVADGGHFRFFGTPRLGERPHQPLLDALANALAPMGTVIRRGNPWPIEVLPSGRTGEPCFTVDGSQSSQFVSSLMLAAAALQRRERRPWTVRVKGPMASEGYLALTLSWMEKAGFRLSRADGNCSVHGWSEPAVAPRIPGDWSSLGYLLAVAWRSGGTVEGVDLEAAHPDRELVSLLRSVGLTVASPQPNSLTVSGVATGGFTATAARCPDLIPTLAVLACRLPLPSRFTQVSLLRAKESDRLEGVLALAAAGGATAHFLPDDSIQLTPSTNAPKRFSFDSKGDHRLAMAAATLAVLGAVEAEISEPHCVAKSFPRFWIELEKAGVQVGRIG